MTSKDKLTNAIIWSLTILCTLIGFWMLISFFDIVTHNMESYAGYGEYLEWNFFTTMWDVIRGQA